MDTESGASRSYDSPVAGRRIVAVAASPDGRHVIFQVEDVGAWLLELRDGSMRRVLEDPTAQRLVWSPSGDAVAYYSGAADQWKVWVRAPDPES
jgi:Tol biopolymer transport system component